VTDDDLIRKRAKLAERESAATIVHPEDLDRGPR
jgi:hypothetical protein